MSETFALRRRCREPQRRTAARGVSRTLVDAVLAHPKVVNVNSFDLVRQHQVMSFYERWGFSIQVRASRLIRPSADRRFVPR